MAHLVNVCLDLRQGAVRVPAKLQELRGCKSCESFRNVGSHRSGLGLNFTAESEILSDRYGCGVLDNPEAKGFGKLPDLEFAIRSCAHRRGADAQPVPHPRRTVAPWNPGTLDPLSFGLTRRTTRELDAHMRVLLTSACLVANFAWAVAQAPAAPRAVRPTMVVQVTDKSGRPIGDVAVRLTGPLDREGTTDQLGITAFTNLRSGTFRLHVEREGFVTLERDVTVRAGSAIPPLDVALTAAPPPPKVEAPPPPPPPPPAPVRAPDEPKTTEVTSFIEGNFIGRNEGKKESNLACLATATATLIQLRDPLPEHAHQTDEMIDLVAGEAKLRIAGRDQVVAGGAFIAIPAGISHSMTRRGKNPVIAISIVSGESCDPAVTKH